MISSNYQKISQKDLAKALKLHKSVLSRYIKKGMPQQSIEAATAWYKQNIGLRKRNGAAPTAVVIGGLTNNHDSRDKTNHDEDFQTARTRREVAEANLAELKVAEQKGSLLRVEAVRAAWARRLGSTRDALLQIPIRAAPVLAAETDIEQVSLILEGEIRQALAELSREGLPGQPEAATP